MENKRTLGVIADTHVPDRTAGLHPDVVPTFLQAEVETILHAGDITRAPTLELLGRAAPVVAVRGNRDGWSLPGLPMNRELLIGGVRIGMLHGHGGLRTYILDSLRSVFQGGLPYTVYINRVRAAFPGAHAVVFGHLHRPVNQRLDDRLIFNPGSAGRQVSPNIPPSIGLLTIGPGESVEGKIIFLARTAEPV